MHDTRIKGSYIFINKKKLLNLCSNDYLGLSVNKVDHTQMQSSSRLVSGNDISFSILEKKLAGHKSQDNALVFPTGYMANIGSISTLAERDDLILSDELNHASIIESCKLADAKISVYKHNDVSDLLIKLRQKGKRKFVITEGIFSMDGDFAKLKQISEVAEKNNAVLILDDAHGDFTVGHDGKGSANHLNVTKKIDVYISSLSKGLGSFGGYVASKKDVIDYLVNKARSFIYTSALPSIIVKDAIKKFDSSREQQRIKLEKNQVLMRNGLQSLGYDIKSPTHIIPIVIGKEKTALEFGNYLIKRGIFAQPIRYPTVGHNQARIRISVTARLEKKEIDFALDIFDEAGKKFRIL